MTELNLSHLPLNNLSKAQRDVFQTHLSDLWDDYQDALSDLGREAKVMVPNATYDEGDPLDNARAMLEDYARQANILAQDYYRDVRAAWAEASGIALPAYDDAQVSSDRTAWQIFGGFHDSDFNGLKFKDVINGNARSGVTMSDLWAKKTAGWDDGDWAKLAKDMVFETARLTGRFNAENDPTKPKYARVPHGKTCAFCLMLASRGFAYWSEESAGGRGNTYHDDCNCGIAPSWGQTKLEGYDPDRLKDLWKECRETAGERGQDDYKSTLRILRADHRDEVTDGSIFDPDMRIPAGSDLERRIGLRRASNVNKLLAQSKHPDTARLWAKYADRYKIINADHTGTAHFDPKDGGIRLDLKRIGQSGHGRRPYDTFFHETGHMLDWMLADERGYHSQGSGLGASIYAEATKLYGKTGKRLQTERQDDLASKRAKLDKMSSDLQRKGHLTPRQLHWLQDNGAGPTTGFPASLRRRNVHQSMIDSMRRILEAEPDRPTRDDILAAIADQAHQGLDRKNWGDAMVDDMLQGALGDDYLAHAWLGHAKENGATYWQAGTGAQDTEAFAEMTSAQLCDPPAWQRIESLLPESGRIYDNIAKEANR